MLNFDKVFPYLQEHIACGHTLSKVVLQNIDFTEGYFYTILPNNALLEKLYFMQGGIIPNEHPKIPTTIMGRNCLFQELTSTEEDIEKFVEAYLKKDMSNLAVLENVICEPTDSNVGVEHIKLVTIENQVYYLANSLTPSDSLHLAFRKTEQIWHTLILLTEGLGDCFLDNLNEQDLKKICKATVYIIISAYDGESYIIWEKHGQTWQYPGFELTELPKNISFLEPKQSG